MKAFKTLRFVPPPLRLRRVFMHARSGGILQRRKQRPLGIHGYQTHVTQSVRDRILVVHNGTVW
jgi:hypothetical protein